MGSVTSNKQVSKQASKRASCSQSSSTFAVSV